ncbi:fibrinogen C domain-containing protein 1 [Stomoxys calcitrans]|uniref:fibrinogen C domain-containing protein 1 n=1 Tax=Stomoxys calcitrans TaxID=35570 RepID=UPI0027E2BD94|nr:fibrinogen C domain-containing protein 1 [Stomoxys calcitrans]
MFKAIPWSWQLPLAFIICCSEFYIPTHGGWVNDFHQNETTLDVIEAMIRRQTLINSLDGMKKSVEQLNFRSYIEENDERDPEMFDIRIDALPEKCQILGTPRSCAEATACTQRSGYYHIKIDQFSNASFLVQCDAHTEGGGWTVIQRRQDGSVDFYRPWDDYKAGFGEVEGEFFIGLDRLHALTNYQGVQELIIQMEHLNETNGNKVTSAQAKYDSFAIGAECDKYNLKRIGKYSGTAGDSLQIHIGCKFSTKDQDNDKHASKNCAESYLGGWWYNSCHWSNLNGHYGDVNHGKGINWRTWMGHTVSLKYVQMMIRRHRC